MRMSYTTLGYTLATLGLLCGSGCADDLSQELNPPGTPDVPAQSDHVISNVESGGSVSSRVDASSMTAWIYFQFAGGKEVTPQDPQDSPEWDLGFQRYQIKVNGGVSGPAGVEVALVAGTPFDSLLVAPSSGYVTDQPPTADMPMEPSYAFTQTGTWYNYNPNTHILTAKEQVYVVHSQAGAYFKLQVTGYYDKAGSSGYPVLRWKSIMAP